jgi:hypothetical protein
MTTRNTIRIDNAAIDKHNTNIWALHDKIGETYHDYCIEQILPPMSAGELMYEGVCNDTQRNIISAFYTLFVAIEDSQI